MHWDELDWNSGSKRERQVITHFDIYFLYLKKFSGHCSSEHTLIYFSHATVCIPNIFSSSTSIYPMLNILTLTLTYLLQVFQNYETPNSVHGLSTLSSFPTFLATYNISSRKCIGITLQIHNNISQWCTILCAWFKYGWENTKDYKRL